MSIATVEKVKITCMSQQVDNRKARTSYRLHASPTAFESDSYRKPAETEDIQQPKDKCPTKT